MANTVTGFYQTLTAAASDATKVLKPTWGMAGSIYWDHKPTEVGSIGQTINIPVPVDPTSAVTDIGVGDVTLTDFAFTNVPIVFNKHPEGGYVVRDFEQFNSAAKIREVFLDAMLTGIHNQINQQVCNLFTTGNFTTNAAIACTGHVVTVPQFLAGMAKLADARVPVTADSNNMSFVLPSTPYTTMMDGTAASAGAAWSQAMIVGEQTATRIHTAGEPPVAFSASIKLDQQMPTTGTAPSRTFTAAYFHRYAVCGVTRALPQPDPDVVDFTYMDWNGMSIRVQIAYNPYPKGGWLVIVDAGYGLAVVRESMGQLFTVAE